MSRIIRPSSGIVAAGQKHGGGSAYHAKAVHFDGNSYLSNASLAAVDSGHFSFSFWLNIPTLPTTGGLPSGAGVAVVWDFNPAGFENTMQMNAQGSPTFTTWNYGFVSSPSGSQLNLGTVINTTNASQWYNYFGYVDANQPQGSKVITLFQSDNIGGSPVNIKTSMTDTGPAFLMPFLNQVLAIPDTPDDFSLPWLPLEMAEIWIAPGVLETDITIFRDPATGKPKNPTDFPTSAVLLSGDHTSFQINQGTGGSFALTGNLTNASSSPSD